MAEQSATPKPPETISLEGNFTYSIGDASPLVEFDGHGRLTVTLEGEVIVSGSYKVIGDMIEVVDEGGPYSNPEFGVGKYKWCLAGKTLTFSLIEDKSKSRLKGFALPWTKVN